MKQSARIMTLAHAIIRILINFPLTRRNACATLPVGARSFIDLGLDSARD